MNKQTLEDLTKDCPCSDKWCFLKEFISHTGISNRDAEQVRLIYDYKFIESTRVGEDIGLERATMEFIDKGFAKKYANIYEEGMHYDELKYKLFVN